MNLFENKVVFCNCNDGLKSEFWKYFLVRFNLLKLKRLIVISYGENSVAYEYNGHEIKKTKLNGNGDFEDFESIQYLRESDVVVTNPPFSLFRRLVDLLVAFHKKFIIIGPMNAITYNNVFNYFMQDLIWYGVHPRIKYFMQQDGTKKQFGNISWFTNLRHNKNNEPIKLIKNYDHNIYKKFDGYNIINIDRTKDIPKDYFGLMGVPLSFLLKWNPDQFQVVGKINPTIEGKHLFARVIIKRRVNENRT